MWGRCKSTALKPGALLALYSAYDLALLIARIEFGWGRNVGSLGEGDEETVANQEYSKKISGSLASSYYQGRESCFVRVKST